MAVITVSRQVAAHGDEVAAELAKLLNYKFVTRKDIEKRIVELGFPESKMPKYDERKPGFFASLAKNRDEYFNYCQYAILEAAQQKNVIIIGRGAFAVLQGVPNNISVRLIADEKTRIERLRAEFNWDEKQARQRIQESGFSRTCTACYKNVVSGLYKKLQKIGDILGNGSVGNQLLYRHRLLGKLTNCNDGAFQGNGRKHHIDT